MLERAVTTLSEVHRGAIEFPDGIVSISLYRFDDGGLGICIYPEG